MRTAAMLTVLLALASAAVAASLASLRAQADAESASNALVLAERSSLKQTSALPETGAPVTSRPAAPAPSASRIAPHELPPSVGFRQTSTYNGAPVFVPEGCLGPYDVLLHFHGAHPYVKDLAERANINAVVAVFNAGNGAEKYAQQYSPGGTLASLLKQIDMAAAPLCGGSSAHPRRIALSAWSAGYAAAEKLVSRPEDRERIDAVLLADGLHAAFMDPRKRTLAPSALQAFREFGELAKQNQKLFAVTHSSIETDGYGSTTECSRFLLQALSLPCDDPLVSAKAGSFSVEGYNGNDKAAHIVQFRQMDATLLSKLRERWSGQGP